MLHSYPQFNCTCYSAELIFISWFIVPTLIHSPQWLPREPCSTSQRGSANTAKTFLGGVQRDARINMVLLLLGNEVFLFFFFFFVLFQQKETKNWAGQTTIQWNLRYHFHPYSYSVESAYPVHTWWIICLCWQHSHSAQAASLRGLAEHCTLLRYCNDTLWFVYSLGLLWDTGWFLGWSGCHWWSLSKVIF